MCFISVYHTLVGPPQWPGGKEPTCSAGGTGDVDLIPGSRGSPGGGRSNTLQYSCLENAKVRGAWHTESGTTKVT